MQSITVSNIDVPYMREENILGLIIMALRASQHIRTNLIIVLIIVIVVVHVDSRPGGRARGARVRIGHRRNALKHKSLSNNAYRLSLPRKSSGYAAVGGGGAALLVGSLALRSFVLNQHKGSMPSRRSLTNGSGYVCANRENFSNFIFNEFRCPLSPIYTANERYCCGPMKQQYCCSFWESGGRAVGAIVGIISACSLFILLIICCLVYYRRHLRQKGTNGPIRAEQPVSSKQSANYFPSESPPPYSEAIRQLS